MKKKTAKNACAAANSFTHVQIQKKKVRARHWKSSENKVTHTQTHTPHSQKAGERARRSRSEYTCVQHQPIIQNDTHTDTHTHTLTKAVLDTGNHLRTKLHTHRPTHHTRKRPANELGGAEASIHVYSTNLSFKITHTQTHTHTH